MTKTFTPSRLTLARERRGNTKRELAEALGVSDRIVSAWEAAEKEPGLDTLKETPAGSVFLSSSSLQMWPSWSIQTR